MVSPESRYALMIYNAVQPTQYQVSYDLQHDDTGAKTVKTKNECQPERFLKGLRVLVLILEIAMIQNQL